MTKLFIIQKKVIPMKDGWCDIHIDRWRNLPTWHVSSTTGTRLYFLQALFYYCYIKLSFKNNNAVGKFRVQKVPLKWWEKNG